MPLLGAHLSIAGGYYKAADRAGELGMETVQIFTKNNNQWRAKPLLDDEVAAFKASVSAARLQQPVSHVSYLINLASPDPELWQRSVEALVIEFERAEALGLMGVVLHPGSHVEDTPESGLKRIVKALNKVHRATKSFAVQTLLETTAGQGSSLGHRFEHLAQIVESVAASERVGVCVDTCHVFAAGYALGTAEEYATTWDEFDRRLGLARIRAFHLNDSVKPFASRVDRHARIGGGCLGVEAFRLLLNDPRFADRPMFLETPKGDENGEALDAINLRTLRELIAPAVPAKKARPRRKAAPS